jgi:uncharacterized protein (TIGR03437 family)
MCGQQYIIATIAGTSGMPGWTGDNGPALSAQFLDPIRVAVDQNLNLYITDLGNQSIRVVNYQTGIINSIAGNGMPGYSGDGGNSVGAQLNSPHDVVVDPAGNVYIADTLNSRVRIIDTHGNINTFAGNGMRGYTGDNGAAVNAQLSLPTGLALDSKGNLYIADFGNATVRKVDTNGKITTIAGLGYSTFGAAPGDGGPATSAVLEMPYSVQVDASGVVYIGDTGTSSIRKVGLDGKIGTYLTNFVAQSFTLAPNGTIYFANYRNNTIVEVLPGGTRISIAGDGIAGDTGDGGQGSQAQLNQPYGVALDFLGDLYIADAFNSTIRQLNPIPLTLSAIANAASLQSFAPPIMGLGDAPLPIAPGEIVVIFGSGVGPQTMTAATPTKTSYPTQVAGTTVSFNGVPAPILYTSATAVSAIVPYEVYGQMAVPVTVTYQGKTYTTVSPLPVAASSPGIFTADSSGSGQAEAFNQDGTANSVSNPAALGSVVTFYGTGEGLTTPVPKDGQINTISSLPLPVQPASVTVNGVPASLDYLGSAPGQVAGMLLFNVEIPTGVPGGAAVPVVLTVGGVASPPVTIAVAGQ